MRYCTKCGKEIVGNKKFCTNCGAKLEDADRKDSSTTKNRAGKNAKLIMLLVAVAFVVIAVVVGKNVLSSKSDDSYVESSEEKNSDKDQNDEMTEDDKSEELSEKESKKKKKYDKKATDIANFKYKVTDEGVCITKYIGTEREVIVPNMIEGEKVTSIGEQAFAFADIDKVTLKEGIIKLGSSAFSHSALYEISLPKGLKEIEPFAFYMDASLKSVDIPATVTYIGDYAFSESGLESVTFNQGKELAVISDAAFSACYSLSCDVVIPGNYLTIGGGAFYKDPITSFKWEKATVKGTKKLSVDAFRNTAVVSVVIEMEIPSVPETCFSGCEDLESVILPDSIEKIENGSFSSCEYLESINIPDGVTSIGESAFWQCSNLTYLEIPSTVEKIEDEAFYGLTGTLKFKGGKLPEDISESAIDENANVEVSN